jgi:hypothetical protein
MQRAAELEEQLSEGNCHFVLPGGKVYTAVRHTLYLLFVLPGADSCAAVDQ